MKTFKQTLNELVKEGKLNQEDADNIVAVNTAQIDSITKPLHESISTYEKASEASTIATLGKFADKDIKILKRLTTKQPGESYEQAVKRTMNEYGIETVKEDGATANANNSAVAIPNPNFKENENKTGAEKNKDPVKEPTKDPEFTPAYW